MANLLILFIVVPAVELALLIEIGGRIGTLPTLGIIVATGAIGATLANRQGVRTVRTIQEQLAAGELPTGALVDGVIILIAGALLITPGVLTDVVGFGCLIPAVRDAVKRQLTRRFERAVQEQRIHVVTDVYRAGPDPHPIVDVSPDTEDDDRSDAPPSRRLH